MDGTETYQDTGLRIEPYMRVIRHRFLGQADADTGQTAMMLALLMTMMMILLPLGVLIIAQSQPAISEAELTSQSALQVAQSGASAYQTWINANTGNAQAYCSDGYVGLTNGWRCHSGTDSRSNNAYVAYSDSSVPGFVNCFGGTGTTGAYLQGDSGVSCLSQPQCPSSAFDNSGWQVVSGTASGFNTGYQFVVDSSSVQNSQQPSGNIYVYATGRAGESGNYTCKTVQVAILDTLPGGQPPQTLGVDLTTCGSSTALPVPPNATSAQVTLDGGDGANGGPGAYPFNGIPGNGGSGVEEQFTLTTLPAGLSVNVGCGATGTGQVGAGTGFANGGAGGNDGGAGGGASAICVGVSICSDTGSNFVPQSNLIAVAGGGGGGGEGNGWLGAGGTGGCAGGVPSSVTCVSPTPTNISIATMTSGGGSCGRVQIWIFAACTASGGSPVSNTAIYQAGVSDGQAGQTGGADGGGGGGGFIGGEFGYESNALGGSGFGGGGGSGGTSWINSTYVNPTNVNWSGNPSGAGVPGVKIVLSCTTNCIPPTGYSPTGTTTFTWPSPYSCGGSDSFSVSPPQGTASVSLTLGVVGGNGGKGGNNNTGGAGGVGQAVIGQLGWAVADPNAPATQTLSVNLGCNGVENIFSPPPGGFSMGGGAAVSAQSSASGGGSSGLCIGAICNDNGATITSANNVVLVGAGGGGGGEDVSDPAGAGGNGGNGSAPTPGTNGGNGNVSNCEGWATIGVGGCGPTNGATGGSVDNNGATGIQATTGADGGGGGGGYTPANSGGGAGALGAECITGPFWALVGCGGGPGGQGGDSFANTGGLPSGYTLSNVSFGYAPLTADGITISTGVSISGHITFVASANGARIDPIASGFPEVLAGASTSSAPSWWT